MTGFATAVGVLLVAYNNLLNLVPAFRRLYVPLNLATAAALILAARLAGLSWRELGLSRGGVAPGLRWGLAITLVVGLTLSTGLAIPRLRPLLADQRLAGMSRAGVIYHALVRIPLGTVVLEELAFRGVLFAPLARTSLLAAVAGTSVAFGLWHIVPTLALLQANQVGAFPAGRLAGVAVAVVATTFGGVLLCLLRIATSGIVAPTVAHISTNSLGTIAAHRAVHTGRSGR